MTFGSVTSNATSDTFLLNLNDANAFCNQIHFSVGLKNNTVTNIFMASKRESFGMGKGHVQMCSEEAAKKTSISSTGPVSRKRISKKCTWAVLMFHVTENVQLTDTFRASVERTLN